MRLIISICLLLFLSCNNAFQHRFHRSIDKIIGRRYLETSPLKPLRSAAESTNCCDLLKVSRCDGYAEKINKSHFKNILWAPIRYLNSVFIGILFTIILRVINRFKAIRRNILLEFIFRRPKGRGLLTVSNHQSVFDDPGLWAAVLPWWRMRPDQTRWTICTEEVFFANRIGQFILAMGNTLPLDRSGSLDQCLFLRFFQELNAGKWCHVFPEGRIWQNWRFDNNETKLGPFKIGVGKILAHCDNPPIILPMYHKGMDNIIPEKRPPADKKKTRRPMAPKSIIPKMGNKVELYVGDPIDVTPKIQAFNEKYPGILKSWQSTPETISLYTELTNDIRIEVLKLEAEAWNREN